MQKHHISILENFIRICEDWDNIYNKIIPINRRSISLDISLVYIFCTSVYPNLVYLNGSYGRAPFTKLFQLDIQKSKIKFIENPSFNFKNDIEMTFDLNQLKESINLLKDDDESISYVMLYDEFIRKIQKPELLNTLNLFNKTVDEYLRLSLEENKQ